MQAKKCTIHTPLGAMYAIADTEGLYLLAFERQRGLNAQVKKISENKQLNITSGANVVLAQVKNILDDYFKNNQLDNNKIPLHFIGTPFQKRVWKALQKIPMGKTSSYSDIAAVIGKPSAFRAVANAIGANPISILVPCHRVIQQSGALGGYAGGVDKKKYLLEKELR